MMGSVEPEQRFSVLPQDLRTPSVAIPTVLVFVAGLLSMLCAMYARVVGHLTAWVSVPWTAVSIFVLFTPMHDASHRSVCTAHRWLNDTIGWLCSLCFMAPFPAFRWVHLEHHKYTNDPERDPDYWSGTGPKLLLPLRWASQELHYYVPYLSRLASRPAAEAVSVVLTLLALWGGVVLLAVRGYLVDVILAWLLPTRLAILALAYSFDYVPHRPHTVPRVASLYRSTSRIDGLFRTGGVSLRVPLLGQDDHVVHHVYPHLPFYQYRQVWDKYREQFLRAGTQLTPFYRHDTPWWR